MRIDLGPWENLLLLPPLAALTVIFVLLAVALVTIHQQPFRWVSAARITSALPYYHVGDSVLLTPKAESVLRRIAIDADTSPPPGRSENLFSIPLPISRTILRSIGGVRQEELDGMERQARTLFAQELPPITDLLARSDDPTEQIFLVDAARRAALKKMNGAAFRGKSAMFARLLSSLAATAAEVALVIFAGAAMVTYLGRLDAAIVLGNASTQGLAFGVFLAVALKVAEASTRLRGKYPVRLLTAAGVAIVYGLIGFMYAVNTLSGVLATWLEQSPDAPKQAFVSVAIAGAFMIFVYRQYRNNAWARWTGLQRVAQLRRTMGWSALAVAGCIGASHIPVGSAWFWILAALFAGTAALFLTESAVESLHSRREKRSIFEAARKLSVPITRRPPPLAVAAAWVTASIPVFLVAELVDPQGQGGGAIIGALVVVWLWLVAIVHSSFQRRNRRKDYERLLELLYAATRAEERAKLVAASPDTGSRDNGLIATSPSSAVDGGEERDGP